MDISTRCRTKKLFHAMNIEPTEHKIKLIKLDFIMLNHTKSVQLSETARMVHETNHFLDDHCYAVSNPVNLPSNSFKYYPPQLEKNRHAPYYAPTKNSQRSYQVQANSQQHQNSQPFFPTNEHDNYITYSQCLSNSNPLYTNSHTVQPNQNQAPLYQVYDMPNPKKVYTIKFKNNQ
ncbi:hypothetical protein BpHYR1_050956 [Brachionus plicatilis]|uniref:Uncharacterized protein n=1 Tax=Brachionus plicatilis TaxID=10195 RepID=A0A3M7QWX3_BRAPC|nr:hypothetical protein BpHYR1_050956 [Brachionus plicatilis]